MIEKPYDHPAREDVSGVLSRDDWPIYRVNDSGAEVPVCDLIRFETWSKYPPDDMRGLTLSSAALVAPFLFENPRLPSGARLFLFVYNFWWQERTRISLYKGLWRFHASLNSRWLSDEFLIDTECGIRFYGLAEIEQNNFEQAILEMMKNHYPLILSTREDILAPSEITRLFNYAYYEETKPCHYAVGRVQWPRFVAACCSNGDIVLRVTDGNEETMAAIDCLVPASAMAAFAAPELP